MGRISGNPPVGSPRAGVPGSPLPNRRANATCSAADLLVAEEDHLPAVQCVADLPRPCSGRDDRAGRHRRSRRRCSPAEGRSPASRWGGCVLYRGCFLYCSRGLCPSLWVESSCGCSVLSPRGNRGSPIRGTAHRIVHAAWWTRIRAEQSAAPQDRHHLVDEDPRPSGKRSGIRLNPSAAPAFHQCSMVSATCSGEPTILRCPNPPPSLPAVCRTVRFSSAGQPDHRLPEAERTAEPGRIHRFGEHRLR